MSRGAARGGGSQAFGLPAGKAASPVRTGNFAGFQTRSGQTGFPQRGLTSTTVCHILL